MNWNYRIVNTKSQNSGEDWYCLQEVYYEDGKLIGYCDPCTGGDDMEELKRTFALMSAALDNPPLQEEDFK